MLKPALKWVGRAFIGAGDNVLRATSKWWDDGAKAVAKEISEGGVTTVGREAAESVGKKSVDDLSELVLSRQFAGDFAAEADVAIGSLKASLSGAKANAKAIILQGDQFGRLEKAIASPNEFNKILQSSRFENYMVPPETMKAGQQAIKDWLMVKLKSTMGNVEQAKAQLGHIDRAVGVLNQPNGVFRLQKLLDVNPEMSGFFGTGLEAKVSTQFRNFMIKVKNVDRLNGSALSDSAFVQKAIQLKSNSPETFGMFMAHPKNAARFEKMQRGDLGYGYVSKMIEKGSPRIPFRRKLLGVTSGETAKRLGLGAATMTGAGYGAIKLYDWFGNNDPQRVAAVSQNTSSADFESTGQGSRILKDIKQSLKNIEVSSNKVNSALGGTEAQAGTEQYLRTISEEKENIKRGLSRWDVVIEGTDPSKHDAAYKMGSRIQGFVNDLERMMGEFTTAAGISGVATRAPGRQTQDQNIVQVQGFLKSLDPSIQATGQLDDRTVNVLSKIESRFNQMSDSDQWTGALVDQASNYVISSSNLKEAFKRIRKYK